MVNNDTQFKKWKVQLDQENQIDFQYHIYFFSLKLKQVSNVKMLYVSNCIFLIYIYIYIYTSKPKFHKAET